MLRTLALVALRNVTRNTRRSFLTMTAMIIGCAAIVFALGLVNALHTSMVEGITQTMTGDVQLHHREYLKTTRAMPLDLAVRLDEALVTVLRAEPRIKAFSGRIRFTGMISNGLTSSPFIGQAVDPTTERAVTPDMPDEVLPGGKPLSSEDPYTVVVANPLALAMGLKVGDVVTVTAATRDGALNDTTLTVVGLRQAGASLTGVEGKIIEIPLKTAQELLLMGEDVTEVVLNLHHLEDTDRVTADLQGVLDRQLQERSLRTNDWKEVAQFQVDVIRIHDLVMWIIIVVLFCMMVTLITATMLMTVLERVREIGTLMAIGVTRRRILELFLLEALCLGGMGATVGIGVGYAIVRIVHHEGIEISVAVMNRPLLVRPEVGWTAMALVLGLALMAALVSALYPARRASLQEPAVALSAV